MSRSHFSIYGLIFMVFALIVTSIYYMYLFILFIKRDLVPFPESGFLTKKKRRNNENFSKKK